MTTLPKVATAAALAALLSAHPASAAPCAVALTGAESDAWKQAADAVARAGLTDRDCTRVQIDVDPGGARVLFTAPDGRTAARSVRDPGEVEATIEALRVTIPAPEPEPQADDAVPHDTRAETEETSRAVPSGPSFTVAPEQDPASDVARDASATNATSASRARTQRGPGMNVALQGGARAGETMMTPVLGGTVSWMHGRWELGFSASAEAQYYGVGTARPPEKMTSAVAAGALLGRREAAGPFDVLYGGRLSVALLLPRNHAGPICKSRAGSGTECVPIREDERVAEWRAGVYAGTAFPRDASLRFRVDVGGDIAPADRSGAQYPRSPAWAAGALLGLELARP